MSVAKFDHPIPAILADLPRDSRGYPIPSGVWQDPKTGEHDFRILDQQIRMQALKEKRCAISGELMHEGEYWFIGGPASFTGRLFVDGPMLREAAEFSLMTCPHLALSAAKYRRTGVEDKFRPAGTTLEKSPILMLAMARSYRLEEIEDFIYVRATAWRAVSWWQDGRRLTKPEAIATLAEVAPHIKMPPG
jgi:hypothetical protein